MGRPKYDKLLLATGSHPIRPPIPGIDLPNVHTCWTLEDARAIVALAKTGKRGAEPVPASLVAFFLNRLQNGVDSQSLS